WDVAVPTYGEQPGLLRDAIGRAARALALLEPPPEPAHSRLADQLTGEIRLARYAAELAERDDMLFSRAQLFVRRALLARGAALGIGDDVFWLPLDEMAGTSAIDPDDARRRAGAARAAAERA